jgi:4a-hydroxytetrahydrobiopterin dehydratase
MAQLLRDDEIDERLRGSAWRREGNELVRELVLGNFEEAVAFVNRVAVAAEERNHHPDILLHSYKKVRLSLSSHSAGGLTELDFELAAAIDQRS